MDKSPFKSEPVGSACLSAVALCKRLFCFHFQWKGTSQPHEKRKGETDMNDISQNNPIWMLYDRAYKKFYARRVRRTMTESAFAQWLYDAQELRDEALKTGIDNIDIEEYLRKLNEV